MTNGDNNTIHDMIYVYEGAQARMERANKRLWIVIIILIAALLFTNAGWIIYEAQFETVSETSTKIKATQDGNGVNIVGNGDINYGSDGTNYENDSQTSSEEK